MTATPTETPSTDATPAHLPGVAPDDPVPVSDGLMACQGCGVAVPRPASPAQIVRVPVVRAYSPTGRALGEAQVALGMCPTCGERAHAAVALAAAHPALVAALGQHRAVEAAEGILTALDILGVRTPTNDISDKRLGILVRNLSTVGLGIRWRTRIAARNLVDLANPHPWAHVRASDRMRLRTAYAAALAERVVSNSGPVNVRHVLGGETTRSAEPPIQEAIQQTGPQTEPSDGSRTHEVGREYPQDRPRLHVSPDAGLALNQD